MKFPVLFFGGGERGCVFFVPRVTKHSKPKNKGKWIISAFFGERERESFYPGSGLLHLRSVTAQICIVKNKKNSHFTPPFFILFSFFYHAYVIKTCTAVAGKKNRVLHAHAQSDFFQLVGHIFESVAMLTWALFWRIEQKLRTGSPKREMNASWPAAFCLFKQANQRGVGILWLPAPQFAIWIYFFKY